MRDWKAGREALVGKDVARVVWIACRADWRGAGVPVAVSRDLFLDFGFVEDPVVVAVAAVVLLLEISPSDGMVEASSVGLEVVALELAAVLVSVEVLFSSAMIVIRSFN